MEKLETKYTKTNREADLFTDTSADYSLPDYNGDIKKVLYTSAAVLPASRYTDGDTVNASGVVSYDMIYINSENELDHLSFSSDYDISFRVRSEGLVDTDVSTRVASFSHRLSGPRRVNMKATLQSEVRSISEAELSAPEGIEGDSNAECLTGHVDVSCSKFLRGREREYADTVTRLEEVIADEVEVLYTGAGYRVDEVRCEEGGVSVAGEFIISSVIRCEGGAPTLYKKKIPFDELIECEEQPAGMSLSATVGISSVSAEVVADEDGAAVNVAIIADCSAVAIGNRELSFVKDAYLKSGECDTAYEKIAYNTHIGSERRICTATHTMPISDLGTQSVRGTVYMSATPKITETDLTDEGVCAKVELKLNGICIRVGEEGAPEYFAVKTTHNSDEKVSFSGQNLENAMIEGRVRAIDAVASVDDENLYIDVTYELSVDAFTAGGTEYLSKIEAREGGEFAPRTSRITVYYPTAGDTLFSVARKYHTGAFEIAAANMLTEGAMNNLDSPDSLLGVKRLVIK